MIRKVATAIVIFLGILMLSALPGCGYLDGSNRSRKEIVLARQKLDALRQRLNLPGLDDNSTKHKREVPKSKYLLQKLDDVERKLRKAENEIIQKTDRWQLRCMDQLIYVEKLFASIDNITAAIELAKELRWKLEDLSGTSTDLRVCFHIQQAREDLLLFQEGAVSDKLVESAAHHLEFAQQLKSNPTAVPKDRLVSLRDRVNDEGKVDDHDESTRVKAHLHQACLCVQLIRTAMCNDGDDANFLLWLASDEFDYVYRVRREMPLREKLNPPIVILDQLLWIQTEIEKRFPGDCAQRREFQILKREYELVVRKLPKSPEDFGDIQKSIDRLQDSLLRNK